MPYKVQRLQANSDLTILKFKQNGRSRARKTRGVEVIRTWKPLLYVVHNTIRAYFVADRTPSEINAFSQAS